MWLLNSQEDFTTVVQPQENPRRMHRSVDRRAPVKAPTPAPVTYGRNKPLLGGPGTVSDNNLRTELRTPYYNGSVYPADNSKNACLYASRPRAIAVNSATKMADRPSMSSSPGSRNMAKTRGPILNRRASRDDYYIGSRAYSETPRSEPYTPFRDEPPTPDISPRTATAQQFTSGNTAWKPTTHYMSEASSDSIGMALGSPTHPPIFSEPWNSQNAAQLWKVAHPITSPPRSRSSSMDNFDIPAPRKQSGKWNLLGMFTRKTSDQSTPPLSISEPNGLHGTNRPEHAGTFSSAAPPGLKSPERSNTANSRKAPRHKPIVVRSQTMPTGGQISIASQDSRECARLRDGKIGHIPITLDPGPVACPMSKPLLNVDIPDIRLERYSVMFNSVLNSNPSLLSRRQATMEKLQRIDDSIEQEYVGNPHESTRRASSPRLGTRSPGLTLFPTSKQGQNITPQKLSPRLRANTSPALFATPFRDVVDHRTPSYHRPLKEGISSSRHHDDRSPFHYDKHGQGDLGVAVTAPSETVTDAVEQKTAPLVPRFHNDQHNYRLRSPAELEPTAPGVIPRQRGKYTMHQTSSEVKWPMASPPQGSTSIASPNTSSQRKPSLPLASSSYTHGKQAFGTITDAISGPEDSVAKRAVAERSIARQISISRQQPVLLPLHTAAKVGTQTSIPATPASSNRRPSHASVAAPENGRIAETKTATPTLVHPPALLDPHANLAQHRRSERVVLEDA
ncbi:hypothetical protein F4777DRAFT_588756 [Nemania sp. FL0916]|nr:hypothetical protein F4777DRAFT_588756 [Nemania sp. FL0916]